MCTCYNTAMNLRLGNNALVTFFRRNTDNSERKLHSLVQSLFLIEY